MMHLEKASQKAAHLTRRLFSQNVEKHCLNIHSKTLADDHMVRKLDSPEQLNGLHSCFNSLEKLCILIMKTERWPLADRP